MKSATNFRFTFNERDEISRGLWNREPLVDIADRINREASTVCREVSRNGGRKRCRAQDVASSAYFSRKLKRTVSKIERVPALKEYMRSAGVRALH